MISPQEIKFARVFGAIDSPLGSKLYPKKLIIYPPILAPKNLRITRLIADTGSKYELKTTAFIMYHKSTTILFRPISNQSLLNFDKSVEFIF